MEESSTSGDDRHSRNGGRGVYDAVIRLRRRLIVWIDDVVLYLFEKSLPIDASRIHSFVFEHSVAIRCSFLGCRLLRSWCCSLSWDLKVIFPSFCEIRHDLLLVTRRRQIAWPERLVMSAVDYSSASENLLVEISGSGRFSLVARL